MSAVVNAARVQARASYPRNPRAQGAFEAGFLAELAGDGAGTGCYAEIEGRRAAQDWRDSPANAQGRLL